MISFYDVTLRDGNHALRHALTPDFVSEYCQIAELSGVWAVEVGHGNGIGASSFLVGKAKSDDRSLLAAARERLQKVKTRSSRDSRFRDDKARYHSRD